MSYSPLVLRLAAWSIAVALAVLALKLGAWWITGSVALLSDALESIVNVVSAMLALSAIRYSRRPADAGHPFGHHKAEYISAVAEGVMIVVAALLVLNASLPALIAPRPLAAPLPGLALNAVAAAFNAGWALLLIRIGRAQRSPALAADGRHLMTDVVTSVGVLAGLGLALATGWAILDPLLAIVVAGNILREGWRVIAGSLGGLLDSAVDEDCAQAIRAAILAHADGAIEVHDIRTRHAGPATFIEFHMVVDGAMSVARSHDICDRVERALEAAVPGAQVLIHVEPGHKAKPGALPVK
ncbi:cation diffusion facilitator family transporter [Rhodobacteraceae bacterium 2CG4]|uniref:Protein p34 n=1 Tax=Halovulum marinum TaxID=2662447 RepID=A0A6L5YX74_9RHOB|nr:cation diffusion facilitator family transporter [Halovulum marinum]MSU88943.1 cation diffusion facilitator family transporter [Halovulum marinum]